LRRFGTRDVSADCHIADDDCALTYTITYTIIAPGEAVQFRR
jgi:hypothetical protein